jgi:hypothetical protein
MPYALAPTSTSATTAATNAQLQTLQNQIATLTSTLNASQTANPNTQQPAANGAQTTGTYLNTAQPTANNTVPVTTTTPAPTGTGTTTTTTQVPATIGNSTAALIQSQQDRANNATLADSEKVTATEQQVQQDELLSNQTIDPHAYDNLFQAPSIQNTTAQAAQEAGPQNFDAAQYQATQANTNQADQGFQAAQGEFTEDELVQGQLKKLLDTTTGDGTYPAWAQKAARAVSEQMAARGLDASTMAGQAIMTALIESALPIAQADAQSLQGIKLQNLSNQQQTSLAKYQAQIQTLLSNQAADNAAKNFNASSQNQINQFLATLAEQVNNNNANRANTINQFNAAEANKTAQNEAALAADLAKAQATLNDQRDQFNTNNSLVVAQSNAQWRRDLNTQNTAAQNEANRINALNTLQISETAYANLWQQFRDESAWIFQASQNEQDRAINIEMFMRQLEQQQYQFNKANKLSDSKLGSSIGGYLDKSGVLKTAGSAISDFIGGLFD